MFLGRGAVAATVTLAALGMFVTFATFGALLAALFEFALADAMIAIGVQLLHDLRGIGRAVAALRTLGLGCPCGTQKHDREHGKALFRHRIDLLLVEPDSSGTSPV